MENEKQKEVKTIKKVNGVPYEVVVHFSDKSKETMNDKIKRMITTDIENEENCKNIKK